MKKTIFFLTLFVISFWSVAQEQLLNASFETWRPQTSLPHDEPTDWWGTSVSCTGLNPVVCQSTTLKTTDAHAGTYAVQLVNIPNAKGQLLYMMDNQDYYAFSSRPVTLTGYYKFNKAGTDKITVTIILSGATTNDIVAYGTLDLTASKTAYTKFTVSPYYLSTDAIQHILISIGFNDNPNTSSVFTMDDLNLTYTTTPTTDATAANSGANFFPNPSTESIGFENAVTNISIQTANGTEVLSHAEKTESLNIASLAPGMYMLSYRYNDLLIHTKLIKE